MEAQGLSYLPKVTQKSAAEPKIDPSSFGIKSRPKPGNLDSDFESIPKFPSVPIYGFVSAHYKIRGCLQTLCVCVFDSRTSNQNMFLWL